MYKEVDPKTIKSGTINIREDIGDVGPLVRKIIARLEVGKSGIAVPLIVTPIDDPDYDYEVIDGERRLQSALAVGLPLVPIVIEKDSGVEPLSWDSYDANDTRLSNTWYEIGKFFSREHKGGMTQQQIAERTGQTKRRQVGYYIQCYDTFKKFLAGACQTPPLETMKVILEKGNPPDYQRIIERVVVDQLGCREAEKVLDDVAKIREMIANWIDTKVSARVSAMIEPIIYEKIDLTVAGVKELLLRESGVLLKDVPILDLAAGLVKKMTEFNSKCPDNSTYTDWEDAEKLYFRIEINVNKSDFRKRGYI